MRPAPEDLTQRRHCCPASGIAPSHPGVLAAGRVIGSTSTPSLMSDSRLTFDLRSLRLILELMERKADFESV
jgi:hypothetical protein